MEYMSAGSESASALESVLCALEDTLQHPALRVDETQAGCL